MTHNAELSPYSSGSTSTPCWTPCPSASPWPEGNKPDYSSFLGFIRISL